MEEQITQWSANSDERLLQDLKPGAASTLPPLNSLASDYRISTPVLHPLRPRLSYVTTPASTLPFIDPAFNAFFNVFFNVFSTCSLRFRRIPPTFVRKSNPRTLFPHSVPGKRAVLALASPHEGDMHEPFNDSCSGFSSPDPSAECSRGTITRRYRGENEECSGCGDIRSCAHDHRPVNGREDRFIHARWL